MLNRSLTRVVTDSQWYHLFLPPVFLLPLRARLSTISHSTDPEPLIADIYNLERIPPLSRSRLTPDSSTQPPASSSSSHTTSPPAPPPPPSPQPLSHSIRTLLPLLRAQPSHYITAHIHARPYLLTVGDKVRLPFHMPHVRPGDVLRLNRASQIGSRDYTMRGAPYLNDRLFECRAMVVGTESEPMRFLEKTKRRQRHVRTVKSKHRFTILTVKELRVKSLEEVEEGGGLEEGRGGNESIGD